MIQEFSLIALTQPIPAARLQVGDIGTVVDVPANGAACIVEFMTVLGKTIAVLEVPITQVRPISDNEVPQARQLTTA